MTPDLRVVTPPHGGAFEVERTPARHRAGLPPLVLIPGIGGPRGTFHHQVRALSADRDVLATNLNPRQAPATEPIDSSVHDVLHVLDAFGIDCADVLGSSFGSCVTARLTERAPDRVRRQVWVAPPVVHHAPWRAAFGPGWLLGGAMMKFSPERYRGDVVRMLAARRIYSVEPDLPEEELALLAGRVTDTELAPFFRRLGGLRDWEWRRIAAPVRPVLVIQGRREHEVTPPDVRHAFERASGRPIALTEGTHMPYLSFPGPFNEIVHDFLGAAERPARTSI